MKYLLAAIFCAALIFQGHSQSYYYHSIIDTNLEWTTENEIWPMGSQVVWNNAYHFNGDDTVIGSIQYQVCHRELYNGGSQDRKVFMRTDSQGRYYIHYWNGENLLYDFNAKVGDTLFLRPGDTTYYYINTIDTVLIDTSYRKRLEIVSNEYNLSWGGTYWIEGVGDIYNGVASIFSPDVGNGLSLCSVKNDTVPFYPEEGPRCYVLGVEDYHEDKLTIFPNPTSDWVSVRNGSVKRAFVIDMHGKVVIQKEFATDSKVISLKMLPTGIYIVRFTTENGSPVTAEKIIKL